MVMSLVPSSMPRDVSIVTCTCLAASVMYLIRTASSRNAFNTPDDIDFLFFFFTLTINPRPRRLCFLLPVAAAGAVCRWSRLLACCATRLLRLVAILAAAAASIEEPLAFGRRLVVEPFRYRSLAGTGLRRTAACRRYDGHHWLKSKKENRRSRLQ